MSSTMPWFRAYADMIDDEKLRLLAFEDRWHFVALLCCKRSGLLDRADSIDLLHRKLAVKLGVQLRELEAIAARLAEVGLIEPETFQPLAWDERQFQSDSSTDRVRAYRERMKKPPTRNNDETVCNVSETPQETDTETDTETALSHRTREDASEPDRPTLDPTDAACTPQDCPTIAGAACLAMRRAGMPHTNPSHPKLLGALAAGVTETELADVVREVTARGGAPPGLAYVCTTAINRRKDAASRETTDATRSRSRNPSALEKTAALISARREREAARDAGAEPATECAA